ncbi:MAG: peptidoglycan DD-metalloendopeptidase family protein [Gammaproteobacteria bacterium]|nr:peptidoglycan DD-metalloendopeptidase family protein [Gammaproteobacteria bacterium]
MIIRGVGLLCCLLLTGCVGESLRWEPRVHVVQSGETLYSIAWRHDLNYRDLARWNGLADADLIIAGQRLRLSPPGGGAAASKTAARSPQRSSASRPKPLPTLPQAPEPVWVWPASGPLLRRFGDSGGLSEGVGIGGRRGETVRAAAAGSVVYIGSGLMGYGQLVIIKHNESYLTAYGHNDSLLVSEGEAVASGQSIATMGLGAGGKPLLHFELRRNGDPLDPLRHLPRR